MPSRPAIEGGPLVRFTTLGDGLDALEMLTQNSEPSAEDLRRDVGAISGELTRLIGR